jgi:hypothetical protein
MLIMRYQSCPDDAHGLTCSWFTTQEDLGNILTRFTEGNTDTDDGLLLYVATVYWATGAANTFEGLTNPERLGATATHVLVSLVFGSFIIANFIQVLTDFKSRWGRLYEYHRKVRNRLDGALFAG